MDPDAHIRKAAFDGLDILVRRHGPILPWERIDAGFNFGKQRIRYANRPRGIFKPVEMRAGALSIKTTIPRGHRVARYDDEAAGESSFLYRLQGTDPDSRDNRTLQLAADHGWPLIYFVGVAPGLYRPIWPVFVAAVDVAGLICRVVVGDLLDDSDGVADARGRMIQRAYATRLAKQRLHQDAFRLDVLRAYEHRCCICALPSPRLLEAAHIIPDHDEKSEASVRNGLSLCRLHHGAFDADLMGIRRDGRVEVGRALLAMQDGVTLEQAIKPFHGRTIFQPQREADRPVPDFLAQRYEGFLESQEV